MNNNSDLSFVVIGFDGYSDLWDDYFYLLNKFWSNRKYDFYLVNNNLKKYYENVKTINCGEDAEWSKKVQVALERIDSKYVCLLLEDFYTKDYIKNEYIDNLINLMNKDELKYCKLQNSSSIKSDNYKNYKYLQKIPYNMPYGISLQPSIWRTDFLKDLVGIENYNAWIFEYSNINKPKIRGKEFLDDCIFDNRNILNIEHGVVQGKYLPSAIKYFESIGYKLNREKRSIMTSREYNQLKYKRIGRKIIPLRLHNFVKRVMNIFGVKFVSDRQKK